MKQLLLLLLLFPCFAMAQYTGNANQKITLGEQTTADGLVYRGVENDTANITPLSDTSAYIILDTVNNKFYNYNRTTNVWSVAGGGVSVSSFSAGTTGLTPSTATTGAVTLGGTLAVANGGTGITSLGTGVATFLGTPTSANLAAAVTNKTGSGALVFGTSPTFVTPALGTPTSGVLTSATGLPIATGLTGLGGANRIPFSSSATALTTNAALTFDASLGRLTVNGINTSGASSSFVLNNSTPLSLFTVQNTGSITVRGTGNIVYNSFSSGENRYQLYSNDNTNNPLMFYIAGGAIGNAYGEFSINGNFDSNAARGGGLYFDTRDNVPAVSIMTKNNNANPVRVVNVLSNGTVGIGTDSPQSGFRLHVVDSVYVGGNVSASAYTTRSDYELKDEIQNISYGINEVMQMQPVKYTYKSNGSTQLGFIAQDLGVITPEVVSFEDKMSVYYNALIPILTKAIQEQQALIKALEQRILILENK